ncbi:AAEL004642-PA [Aedes aegypti]|uniref:AAEL004642-PA n=1 Tax=Aedes aegypti TaxID=7159 RepID=Q17C89_AEDAE|nr:AAEL004642-PA [Aedes aegypti]
MKYHRMPIEDSERAFRIGQSPDLPSVYRYIKETAKGTMIDEQRSCSSASMPLL